MQIKFPDLSRNADNGYSKHGYTTASTATVIINALGFVGFKVISVAGNSQVKVSF